MNIGHYQTNTEFPVAVEAVQFRDLETVEETVSWMGPEADWFIQGVDDGVVITVPTPDGTANQIANVGDWIIKGKLGGFYVVKAEDFALRYSVVAPNEVPPAETVAEQMSPEQELVDPGGPRVSFNQETDVLPETLDLQMPIESVNTDEVDTGAPTEVVVEEQRTEEDLEEPVIVDDVPSEEIVDEQTGETVVVENTPTEEELAAESESTQES